MCIDSNFVGMRWCINYSKDVSHQLDCSRLGPSSPLPFRSLSIFTRYCQFCLQTWCAKPAHEEQISAYQGPTHWSWLKRDGWPPVRIPSVAHSPSPATHQSLYWATIPHRSLHGPKALDPLWALPSASCRQDHFGSHAWSHQPTRSNSATPSGISNQRLHLSEWWRGRRII